MHGTCYALESKIYDGGDRPWYFEPQEYLGHRFILGTVGQKPLICFGINPSTARPNGLDRTLQSVESIANNNGFDSWIMFNVYPQRATDPNGMHHEFDNALHKENLAWLNTVLQEKPQATLWAAWGTLIAKRPYLAGCLQDISNLCAQHAPQWCTFGKRSKAGHPHHPLYLRTDSAQEPFAMGEYLAALGVM